MRLLRLLSRLLSTAACVGATSRARNPLRGLARLHDAAIATPAGRVHAHSVFDLSFTLYAGTRVRLGLEPNAEIIPEGASVTVLRSDGSVKSAEVLERGAHRVYKGTAWLGHEDGSWTNAGWARIVVLRDGKEPVFEGAFTVDHVAHHVQTARSYERTRHELDPRVEEGGQGDYMVLWRDSDILPSERRLEERSVGGVEEMSCMSDALTFNMQPDNNPVFKAMLKRDESYLGSMSLSNIFGLPYSKRQIDTTPGSGNSAGVNLSSTIGNPAGCPTTRKVALVGVAADCTYTQFFNSSVQDARSNIITQMNSASSLYESTFNITLGLQNLTVVEADCPATPPASAPWNEACSNNVQIQDRLNTFSAWRGTQNDNNSHWTLLSTCNTNATVGLAWLGQACVNTASTSNSSTGDETVSGANVVIKTSTEWQVIAHETGHTFGAVHDCTSQTCSDGVTVQSQQCCPLSTSTCDAGEQYIMNPSTAQGIMSFSACTVGNICSAIGRNSVKTSCLSNNKGVVTITGQQCGNGIVEEGEDCDCGGTDGCGADPCCDPNTCKFTSGSVCDDSNEDCCSGCQFMSNGTVCRASTGSCDPQEVCPGNSATCPADVTAPNGQSCGSGLQCASGQCTSRDQQCKSVMGSYTQGNDTYACDSTSCSISCASPEFGPGACWGLQQNFLDGTPCSGGGSCNNGQCTGTSFGGEVKSWIASNKPLVIGLAASIGSLLLLSILGCCWRCFRRRRTRPLRKAMPPGPNGSSNGSRVGLNPAPPALYQAGLYHRDPNELQPPAGQPGWYGTTVMSGAHPGPRAGWNGPLPPVAQRPPMASVRYA